MTLKIATTSDSESEMWAALERRGGRDHSPLPIDTTLTQRRGTTAPDEVVVSSLDPVEPGVDGTVEHGNVRSDTYRDGRLVRPHVNQALTEMAPYYDAYAVGKRNAEAAEHLSDYDEVIGQDIPLPASVVLVTMNHPRGSMLGYWLGRNPEFCAALCDMDPLKARVIAEQKANSLGPDDLAQWYKPRHFRNWRAGK